ncbi:hypothetical protein D9M71_664470 [compost metagenome]
MHITHGQPTGLGDHWRRQVRVAQLLVDVLLDALQMQGGQVRAFAAQHPLIITQCHQQRRKGLLQQHMPGGLVALVETCGAHRQLVDKDPPECAPGVEAQARVAFGSAQLAMQRAFGELEHPQIVVAGIVKAVGRIAPFEDEATGLAMQGAAVLFEVHFAAPRYGDEVAGFAVFTDLGFAARIAQLTGAQA